MLEYLRLNKHKVWLTLKQFNNVIIIYESVIRQTWQNVNNWWIHAKGTGEFILSMFLSWKASKPQKIIKNTRSDLTIWLWCSHILLRNTGKTPTNEDIHEDGYCLISPGQLNPIRWVAFLNFHPSLQTISNTLTTFLFPGKLRLLRTNSHLPRLPTTYELVYITHPAPSFVQSSFLRVSCKFSCLPNSSKNLFHQSAPLYLLKLPSLTLHWLSPL